MTHTESGGHARALRDPVVLLTGFDAFDGAAINPSWLAVQVLHGREIAGHRVVSACLPTVFGRSLDQLSGLLAAHQPRLVLSVGLAAGRSTLSLERVAINVIDARIPDNAGAQPVDLPVIHEGPTAYFSTLPLKAMLQALQRAGLPAELSHSAGTFVCNHVFYGLMHALATNVSLRGTRGGFMHVPGLSPAMGLPLADCVRGLQLAVEAALTHAQDPRLPAGSLH